MTYQEYLQMTNNLMDQKDDLYEVASKKLALDDKSGAQRIYAEIDKVQEQLDAFVDPNDEIPSSPDELDLKFDS